MSTHPHKLTAKYLAEWLERGLRHDHLVSVEVLVNSRSDATAKLRLVRGCLGLGNMALRFYQTVLFSSLPLTIQDCADLDSGLEFRLHSARSLAPETHFVCWRPENLKLENPNAC